MVRIDLLPESIVLVKCHPVIYIHSYDTNANFNTRNSDYSD